MKMPTDAIQSIGIRSIEAADIWLFMIRLPFQNIESSFVIEWRVDHF